MGGSICAKALGLDCAWFVPETTAQPEFLDNGEGIRERVQGGNCQGTWALESFCQDFGFSFTGLGKALNDFKGQSDIFLKYIRTVTVVFSMCADPGSAEAAEPGSLLGGHIHGPYPRPNESGTAVNCVSPSPPGRR